MQIWIERIKEISQKYSLSPEKSTILENSVFYILIGLASETDFADEITLHLGLSSIVSEQITEEIQRRLENKIKLERKRVKI